MKKFTLVFGGFLLGVIVMLPFVLEFSFLDQTLDTKIHIPGAQTISVSSAFSRSTEAVFIVTHIVDGDTIDVQSLAGKAERIRLIGIDTPETVDPRKKVQCYGPEASAHMKTLLAGKTVTLAAKPDEDHDTYGRLLRYVFLDGRDIGKEMIQEGYALSLCAKFPHPKCAVYDAAQKEAEAAGRGRWIACAR